MADDGDHEQVVPKIPIRRGLLTQSIEELLQLPIPGLLLQTRPWWFAVQDLQNPSTVFLDKWVANALFGDNYAAIQAIQWMSQTLLAVETTASGNLRVSIFGRPRAQNKMKRALLNFSAWHQERRERVAIMNQLEEFLKNPDSGH